VRSQFVDVRLVQCRGNPDLTVFAELWFQESDDDKGKNKISMAQMKTGDVEIIISQSPHVGMAGMKLEEPCAVCKKTVIIFLPFSF